MEVGEGRFHAKDTSEIIWREYLVFECSCQMSRTLGKQVKIRRNNNARAQWPRVGKANDKRRTVNEWQQKCISPLKDSTTLVEQSENRR